MPSASDHRNWAARLEKLYSELGGADATWSDWALTILFYVGVHEVIALLRDRWPLPSVSRFPDDHRQRREVLRTHWPDVAVPYERLFDWSVKTRYECFLPRKIDLQGAEQLLGMLRAEIAKV